MLATNTSLPIRETLQDKRVLLIGPMGFLGGTWLVSLLSHAPELGRVFVLVRGKRGESAQLRFYRWVSTSPLFRSLRAQHGKHLKDLVRHAVHAVEGDVSKPQFGLSDSAARALADQIDVVVNFAGITDFEPDPRLALAVNVDGACNAVDFAARTKGKRFLHISTAYVCGMMSGEIKESVEVHRLPDGREFDAESEMVCLRRICDEVPSRLERAAQVRARALELGWPNTYTYTKALAEKCVAARSDVHSTLVRPAIVESALAFPFPGWNQGINTSAPLAWLLSTSFRKFPSRPHHRFDVVPVDLVARAVTAIAAALLRGEAKRVYHLGSSHLNPFTFGRAIDLTALGARRMYSRPNATPFEKYVLKHLDAVPTDAHRKTLLSSSDLQKVAKTAREVLRKVDVQELLPPALYKRAGASLEARVRSWSTECRNFERKLSRIDELLRLYMPFIHDHDWMFRADHIAELNGRLCGEEKEAFGFAVDSIDWHCYWLHVHMPGLETWSFPLIRGARAPEDPPLFDVSELDEERPHSVRIRSHEQEMVLS